MKLLIFLAIVFAVLLALVVGGSLTGRVTYSPITATLSHDVLFKTSIEVDDSTIPSCPQRLPVTIHVKNTGSESAVAVAIASSNIVIVDCIGCAQRDIPPKHTHTITFAGCANEDAHVSISAVNSNEVVLL